MPTTITNNTFQGYTLSEMRSLVLQKLRVTDTTRYSPTKGVADYTWVDQAINRSQRTFTKKSKCFRTFAILELAANQRTYRAPADYIDLMAAYYYDSTLDDGYRELTVKTIEELNDEYSDWRKTKGDAEIIYVDRQYGAGTIFGLYPIPDAVGGSPTFTSDTGVAVEWVCPYYELNQDYGVIIRMTDADEYVLSTEIGTALDITPADGNVVIEYYRLPQTLSETTQVSEIPYDFQDGICDDAAAYLLENNPEDSAEFKRSVYLTGKAKEDVDTFVDKRKSPLSGRQLQVRPNVWGWQKNNMDFRKEMF